MLVLALGDDAGDTAATLSRRDAFDLADRAEEVEAVRHGGYEDVEAELNRVIEYIEQLG